MSISLRIPPRPAFRLPPRPGARRRVLLGLELVTGLTGVAGGLLLVIAPDGSLMAADPRALHGSPFTDWRVPGLLLASLVGGGFLLTAWWQRRDGRRARQLSIVAGAGLVTFEAFELAWIGFQPLEAVFAAVGAAVLILAATDHPAPSGRGRVGLPGATSRRTR